MDVSTLEGLSLPDPEGTEHVLGGLWRDRTIVLVLLRHFG
jgi:hypothetical protein